jgi:hypothetical protein
MLEVGRTYRGCFEKKMMCTVLDRQKDYYLLLWLTTSGNPCARDAAGETEWERACDAENYLEELP